MTPTAPASNFTYWTNRQVRRSGLCSSCWMRESKPDILVCDGGSCHRFSRFLDTFR